MVQHHFLESTGVKGDAISTATPVVEIAVNDTNTMIAVLQSKRLVAVTIAVVSGLSLAKNEDAFC